MRVSCFAAALTLLTSCALRAPPPQEVRIVVVYEGGPPAAAPAPTYAPAPATTPAPAYAPAPTPAPAAAAPTDPYDRCTSEHFATGWVDARCDEMSLFIQAGRAGRGGDSFLSSVSLDRVQATTLRGPYGFWKPTTIRIGGKTLKARRIRVRKPKRVTGFGGMQNQRDPEGEVRFEGVQIRVSTPRSGRINMSCFAATGNYQRSRCAALISRIIRDGLPGGAVRSRGISLLGRELNLGKRCWSDAPRSVYCLLKGGLEWHEGSTREMQSLTQERIQSLSKIVNTDCAVDDQITERACTVLGHPATCTRVVHAGCAPKPLFFLNVAFVPDGDRATVLECPFSRGDEQAPPCSQVFGPRPAL